ncbi:hypothetical protein M3O96_06120 [Aquiflexum sp. TKW24L]|uniref:hypothetical protein n=1 Tax=Aquiflexum sp. TKW24L TaxID=2942212 RepID=UPI0020C0113E|nr:hypothetical protein [Aquiflexum sp. TKW24L]MCL6258653.1 hypothetical protein [Aquiflexum sp. TKW24L]
MPAVVDVLIDFNGNLAYDEGIDLIISQQYDAPGTYQIYWNGEDANGNVVPKGSDVEVIATVVFFPVHFPIFDLEQSLGMRVTNIRPGSIANTKIFWDDSLILRTGLTLDDSPQSLMVNTTGVMGPDHIWWATGTVQEKDKEKFILQRSKDGKSWSEISETKGEVYLVYVYHEDKVLVKKLIKRD